MVLVWLIDREGELVELTILFVVQNFGVCTASEGDSVRGRVPAVFVDLRVVESRSARTSAWVATGPRMSPNASAARLRG